MVVAVAVCAGLWDGRWAEGLREGRLGGAGWRWRDVAGGGKAGQARRRGEGMRGGILIILATAR